ncbi:MAG TPA: hypothetical protein VHE30_09430 [Polyangiaceae bacterium]|nr:hypothetical protein [Polyangiaceae bacterium]
MSHPGGTNALRATVYGLLVLGAFSLGCGPKGCSCKGLPKNPLFGVQKAPVHSDVEMISEGAEPKVALRVARWAGLRYRLIVEGSGSMALEGGPPLEGPTVTTTVDREVLRGSADPIVTTVDGGTMDLIEERAVITRMAVRQPGAAPGTVDAWNRMLHPLEGTPLRFLVAESAAVVSVEGERGDVAPPKEVQAMVKQTLETQRHFPFRLPSVPVGVGARWRFSDRLEFAGIQIEQIAEMTLKSLSESTAIVGLVLRQGAARQTIPHPFYPGKVAMVEQFRGDGDGQLEVDRLTAIVKKGRLVSAARLTLTGEINGQVGTGSLTAMSTMTSRGMVLDENAAGADDSDGGAGEAAPGAPAAAPAQAAPPTGAD